MQALNLSHIHTLCGLSFIYFTHILFQYKSKKINNKIGLFIKNRPEQKCFKCHGFGIKRCNLCKGIGMIFYEKKYSRVDPCPKCFQKRYDMCSFCKGSGSRVVYNKNTG